MTTAEAISVEVPDIGDFDDVPIIEILVAPGDTVAAEDPLVTLESDKATMDVPAPSAGTVKEIQVKVGDRVSQGAVLMTLEPESGGGEDDGSASEATAAPAASEPTAASAAPDATSSSAEAAQAAEEQDPPETPAPQEGPTGKSGNGGGPIYASPAVRRFARELDVALDGVSGVAARDGSPRTTSRR